MWFQLHNFACFFPEKPTDERRKSFVTLMESLAANLPCSICALHLLDYMKQHPLLPATETREKLERWMYDLHEDVNKRRGKPSSCTFEDVKRAFQPNKAWIEWGGYPIMSSVEYRQIQRNSQTKGSSLSVDQISPPKNMFGSIGGSENSAWVWIVVITVLCVVLLVSVLIGFLLWKRCRMLQNRSGNQNHNSPQRSHFALRSKSSRAK